MHDIPVGAHLVAFHSQIQPQVGFGFPNPIPVVMTLGASPVLGVWLQGLTASSELV